MQGNILVGYIHLCKKKSKKCQFFGFQGSRSESDLKIGPFFVKKSALGAIKRPNMPIKCIGGQIIFNNQHWDQSQPQQGGFRRLNGRFSSRTSKIGQNLRFLDCQIDGDQFLGGPKAILKSHGAGYISGGRNLILGYDKKKLHPYCFSMCISSFLYLRI